ncbi:Epsin-3, clathrin recruitment and traffic between the Golgi and endosome [Taxawa tesnikishii (nom. ined.)]|nr:Epsin-3, clathrin recruitment and traffic between the Golgi and endosome [Dothideales sp. JES 119]
MPMIYKRFTEKSAEEWRQIYKALQLMEFLVKNGSERVIDDARSHLSLLKMLRQFHYIDQNGKDQGINGGAKEGQGNKNKYGGVEGGAGIGGSGISSSSRYGGFGSESGFSGAEYGASSRGVYGDGGAFGANLNTEDDYGESRSRSAGRDRFEEYDEYDEGAVAASGRRKQDTTRTTPTAKRTPKKAEPPKPKEPEVDLFSFGDDDVPAAAPAAVSNGKQAVTSSAGDFGALQSGGADDDDFDDFQSAAAPAAAPAQPAPTSLLPPVSMSTTTSSTQFASPQPRAAAGSSNFSNIFSTTSPAPSNIATPSVSAMASPVIQQQPARPAGYQAAQPNYFTSVSTQPSQASPSIASPGIKSPQIGVGKPKAAGGDAFASLLSGTKMSKANTPTNKGLTMADMAKQKASAGIWGTTGTPSPAPAATPAASQPHNTGQRTGGGGALDDLLG